MLRNPLIRQWRVICDPRLVYRLSSAVAERVQSFASSTVTEWAASAINREELRSERSGRTEEWLPIVEEERKGVTEFFLLGGHHSEFENRRLPPIDDAIRAIRRRRKQALRQGVNKKAVLYSCIKRPFC